MTASLALSRWKCFGVSWKIHSATWMAKRWEAFIGSEALVSADV